MKSIYEFVSRICQPVLRKGKDLTDQPQRLKKNKLIFWLLFGMMVIQPVTIPLSDMPLNVNLIIMIINVLSFVIFVVFCRSLIWIFNVYWTILCSFGLMIIMDIDNNVAFVYSVMAISMPGFVLVTTSDLSLMCITGSFQILTALTTYRRVLRTIFLQMDGEEIMQMFISTSILAIVFFMGVFGFVLQALEKRSQELVKSKKETEDALEQQRIFIFSFSHELRNPLNSLLGNLQLALMSTIATETKEAIRTAKVCGELLLYLINNVLDTGKSDLGKLEISLTPTKVHDMFQRIWAISSDLISRKKLKTHLKIEKRIPPVLMLDGHRINQVMMNLIGNAIKFTSSGSITITVVWLKDQELSDKCFEPIPYDSESEGVFEKEESLYMLSLSDSALTMDRNEHFGISNEHLVLTTIKKDFHIRESTMSCTEQEKGVLKIIVKDTGSGIDEEGLKKLFQKFSQVSNDPSKRQIGTGLGLYITKEICKNMQGDVRAFSQPSVGTTFIVCLPTWTASHAENAHLSHSPNSLVNILMQRSLKVIVADDSPFNVNMISSFMKKVGSQIAATADNGYDAYMKYKESREAGRSIDLVTLDIDMPKMDGKVACQKIRQFEREKKLSPTVIFFISGNYNEKQVNDYLDSHRERRADFFLKKPLLFEELCSACYRFTCQEGGMGIE